MAAWADMPLPAGEEAIAAHLAAVPGAPTLAEFLAAVPIYEAEQERQAARAVLLDQIAELEAGVTQRRIREAVTGQDGGWLAARDAEIAVLRAQLAAL